MKKLIYLELLKLKNSKIHWVLSIMFLTFSLIPLIYVEILGVKVTPITAIEEIYYFNLPFIFPLITIVFFSWLFSNDYEKNRIHFFKSSVFSLNKIFLSKIIIGISFFLLIQIPMIITLFCLWIYKTSFESISIQSGFSTSIITWEKFLLLNLATYSFVFFYLLMVGFMTVFINIIVKNRFLTIALSFTLLLSFKLLEVPPSMVFYTFFRPLNLVNTLSLYEHVIYDNIQMTLSIVGYSIIFYIVNSYLFKRAIKKYWI